jgi:hypothetical protein
MPMAIRNQNDNIKVHHRNASCEDQKRDNVHWKVLVSVILSSHVLPPETGAVS